MTTKDIQIAPYEPSYREEVLQLAMLAWDPVFPLLKNEIPHYVYSSFYPDGWEKRQHADIAATLQDEETHVWISTQNGAVTGFVGVRVHDEDCMGEIYVIAVHPEYQRQGISSALMSFAFDWLRQQELAMVMVETGGDEGHAAARAAYLKAGFERYPVARYFRKL